MTSDTASTISGRSQSNLSSAHSGTIFLAQLNECRSTSSISDIHSNSHCSHSNILSILASSDSSCSIGHLQNSNVNERLLGKRKVGGGATGRLPMGPPSPLKPSGIVSDVRSRKVIASISKTTKNKVQTLSNSLNLHSRPMLSSSMEGCTTSICSKIVDDVQLQKNEHKTMPFLPSFKSTSILPQLNLACQGTTAAKVELQLSDENLHFGGDKQTNGKTLITGESLQSKKIMEIKKPRISPEGQNSLTPLRGPLPDTAIKHCMHAFNFSLKDFDIGGSLGDGAHGIVFIARERRTQYLCVLKCITKAHLIRCNQEPMLKKEIELQAHLKHPHIACMYTWFATSSAVFLVMEYCYHGDLFGYLDRYGPFTEQRISQMLFEITWAIRSCHDKRIAHLDLKPENILIDHRERCKLADFGLSAHIGSKHGPVSVSRGTHDYWSPEQCARGSRVGPVCNTNFGNYDYKTDIWALGVLAFELRFGFPPFGSTNENGGGIEAQNIVMTKIQKVSWKERLLTKSTDPNMSEEFENFLETCLNKNPDKRPTAENLLHHKFIAKYNESRLNDPNFLSQPRPLTRGFNNVSGPFLTPTLSTICTNSSIA